LTSVAATPVHGTVSIGGRGLSAVGVLLPSRLLMPRLSVEPIGQMDVDRPALDDDVFDLLLDHVPVVREL